MRMSPHVNAYRSLVALTLTVGGMLASVIGIAAARAALDSAVPVHIFGAYSNLRYTEEHAYGYLLRVWKVEDRLVGLFSFTEGRQADFDTGTLDNVTFDPKTGRMSFDSYDGLFRFSGTLRHDVLSGRLTRVGSTDRRIAARTERVRLRRSRSSVEVMGEYPNFEDWKAEADAILKRLGPRRPSGRR
jgi:hypothetical protein